MVESESILAAGLERLLTEVGGFSAQCVGVDQLSDLSGVIEYFRPDVLLMDDVYLMANIKALYGMLQEFPAIRVITLNLNSNCMQVFDKRQILVRHSSDLFAVIKNSA